MRKLGYIIIAVLMIVQTSVAQKNNTSTTGGIDHQGKHHDIQDHKLWKKVKIADNLLLQHSYYNAVDIYKEVERELPSNPYVLHQMANAYFVARDYANAEKYFFKACALSGIDEEYPMDRFKYAETLKMNAKYDDAITQFSAFLKKNRKKRTGEMKRWIKIASNEVRSCNYAKAVVAEDSTYHNVDFIDGDVNHAYTDFSPLPMGKDTLIFASLRQDSIVEYQSEEDAFRPVKLFSSVKTDDVWSTSEELPFNNPYEHTANGVYSSDQNRFYFTRCYLDRHNGVICNIYYSEKDTTTNTWKSGHKVGGKVNMSGYTSTQPTIQHIRKKKKRRILEYDVIYFVSNRPGGLGGKDIWYSVVNGDKFSAPLNCGKRVNTIRDEVTPHYVEEEKKMYFSSNYHYGLGGYDAFVSTGYEARFRKPTNLGMPSNSSYDDTYYVPVVKKTDTLDYGYLVSNRPGGIALTSETCCDDIYTYEEYIPEYIDLSGVIQEALVEVVDTSVKLVDSLSVASADTLKTPSLALSDAVQVSDSSATLSQVDSSKVEVKKLQFAKGVKVGYVRKKHIKQVEEEGLKLTADNLAEHVVWSDPTDEKGEYGMKLLAKKNYSLVVQKEGKEDMIVSLDEAMKLAENGKAKYDIVMKDVVVIDTLPKDTVPSLAFEKREKLSVETNADDLKKNEKLVLDDMYFDTNKDRIKKSSRPSLDLLLKFMTKNEKIKIEISGHTDSRGHDDYNMDLSQRRSESVMQFLIDNGIKENRLVAKGYGETEPIAPNENKDGSDNPEGRKLNRRTEIKILSNKK